MNSVVYDRDFCKPACCCCCPIAPPPLDSTRGQAGLTDPHFAISFLRPIFIPRKM